MALSAGTVLPEEEIRIVDTRDEPIQGAMMVVGFPTHGLVGSVAASYLVHALDMTSVAYLTSDQFPPTVIMEEGVVSAPVRFYVSKLVCGVDRSCEQLLVALSDIQPPPETLPELSRRLLDWAERRGVQLIVVVEGQPVDEAVQGDARVVAMANRAAAPLLGKYHFEPANGVITGFAGGLLLAAIGRQIPVLCLVAQAHKDFPDARAAAKVIESINPLVPLLLLDTKPLREKAEEIEAEVRHNLKQQEKATPGLRPPDTSGPGEMYR